MYAIGYLKEEYGMKEYVLVGHSAGACLAFQCSHVPGCRGILGVEGIYDIEELVKEYPEYIDFVEEAFGSDKTVWRKVSPTKVIQPSPNMVVKLVQSTEDELLSPRQTQLMFSKLQTMKVQLQDIAWIEGSHDNSIRSQEFCALAHNFTAQLLQP